MAVNEVSGDREQSFLTTCCRLGCLRSMLLLLRWLSTCRMLIRDQHLWRGGKGTQTGQKGMLSYNDTGVRKASVDLIRISGAGMALHNCPELG